MLSTSVCLPRLTSVSIEETLFEVRRATSATNWSVDSWVRSVGTTSDILRRQIGAVRKHCSRLHEKSTNRREASTAGADYCSCSTQPSNHQGRYRVLQPEDRDVFTRRVRRPLVRTCSVYIQATGHMYVTRAIREEVRASFPFSNRNSDTADIRMGPPWRLETSEYTGVVLLVSATHMLR